MGQYSHAGHLNLIVHLLCVVLIENEEKLIFSIYYNKKIEGGKN